MILGCDFNTFNVTNVMYTIKGGSTSLTKGVNYLIRKRTGRYWGCIMIIQYEVQSETRSAIMVW